jgi:hypothetical protein
VENAAETVLVLLVGQWMMRRIRRQDAEIDDPPFSARALVRTSTAEDVPDASEERPS